MKGFSSTTIEDCKKTESLRIAEKLKSFRKRSGLQPKILAAKLRNDEMKDWMVHPVAKYVTEENVLEPFGAETFWTTKEGLKTYVTLQGYWGVTLAHHSPNDVEWSLLAKTGSRWVCAPSRLYEAICRSLGYDAYVAYKEVLLDDLASAKECLLRAAKTLREAKVVAHSYVCSGSSERLLRRLGVPMSQDWAFLFGHYDLA